MKSLPKRSYAGAALFLLCGFGWCGAVPLRAAEVASETVVVSTLDVRSDASRVTCVQLQSTARLDYNVSKPEPRLVSIDLYGADTSALQPEYRAEQGLVASVAVKAGLVGEATARLDITLREDCHVRSYLRNDAKTLVIEFEPLSPAAAGGDSGGYAIGHTGNWSFRCWRSGVRSHAAGCFQQSWCGTDGQGYGCQVADASVGDVVTS